MEVRGEVTGEVRGERGCFMGAMRALMNTIRNRLKPKRARQRTKNHRICQNSAMTLMKSAKERKLKKQQLLSSGLNIKPSKPNPLAKGTPNSTAQRGMQKQTETPGEVQERLKSSLQAFRERRKPRWVVQTRVEFPPAELLSEAKENVENTQAGEDLQSGEPASWVMAYGQMWQKMTEQDGPVPCSMPITYSDPGSSSPVPLEWTLDHLMENLSSSANKEGGEQESASEARDMEETQAGDHLQSDEPASWVVAYGQMWLEMTEQDGSVPCSMPIMYYSESEVTDMEETPADEDLQSDEPASWVMAYGQMWQKMTEQDASVPCSMPIMHCKYKLLLQVQ
ncbi:uncharacterized protein LOC134071752 [Sardina pilchardus]|uniref:uncharacterized protein LOC134071752 n=1 Tax=Sardina pilchardus TaxID=27697 RepID=UPI002E0EB3A5